jgi:hypothetical protein
MPLVRIADPCFAYQRLSRHCARSRQSLQERHDARYYLGCKIHNLKLRHHTRLSTSKCVCTRAQSAEEAFQAALEEEAKRPITSADIECLETRKLVRDAAMALESPDRVFRFDALLNLYQILLENREDTVAICGYILRCARQRHTPEVHSCFAACALI